MARQWSKLDSPYERRLLRTLRDLTSPQESHVYAEATKRAKNGLWDFASATVQQRIRCQHFTKVRTSPLAIASKTKQQTTRSAHHPVTPDDYPSFVNGVLYDTLREYTICRCSLNEGGKESEHKAQLCLTGRSTIDHNLVIFDLHCWSQPYGKPNLGGCQWQQLRLHVPKYVVHARSMHSYLIDT